ncbi:hypothetical protein [Serratia fonticola]
MAFDWVKKLQHQGIIARDKMMLKKQRYSDVMLIFLVALLTAIPDRLSERHCSKTGIFTYNNGICLAASACIA